MPKTNMNVSTKMRDYRVSAGHRGGEKLAEKFRVSHFSTITYVQGETLKRFWHQPDYKPDSDDEDAVDYSEDKGVEYFLIYNPTENQIESACDRCPTRHRPKNMACSANSISKISPYTDVGKLYEPDGTTRRFEIIDEESPPGKAFVTAAWVRLL